MHPQERVRTVTHRGVSWTQLVGLGLLCCLLAVSADAQTSRIKRISLMTPDLDQSIAFFAGVVGFTLDFEGTLPPGGEPFLGPVFNIDAEKPIRRALLSTSTEARGLFLIEHPEAPVPTLPSPLRSPWRWRASTDAGACAAGALVSRPL